MKDRVKGRKVLTVSDFADFLNAKKVSSLCPSCNESSTAINIDDEGNVVRLRYPIADVTDTGEIGTLPDGLLVAAATTCKNCGYMRAFSAATVERWLDEQHMAKNTNNE